MIDSAAKAVLDATNAGPPMDQLGLDASRESVANRQRPVITEVASVVDLVTQVPEGVGLRLYRPSNDGFLPVIVYAHGGGWILGSVESADETCRRLALASGCAVASVEYRLAPEHPHPAAVLDIVEVMRWLPTVSDEYGIDSTRLFLAGESSGAHVALSAALTGATEDLEGVLLLCPPVDRGMSSPSWAELGGDHIPRRSQMAWMWDLYYGAGGEHMAGAPDPAVADLSRLPRTVVLVAEYDPLRDEGLDLAARLRAVGVETVVVEALGQIHPVAGYASIFPACADYLDQVAGALVMAPGTEGAL